MIDLILEPYLSEPTFTNGLVLDGVVTQTKQAASVGLVYWRWEDEPTAFPQFLGSRRVGASLQVPFENPDRRAVRFYLVGRSKGGNTSVQDILRAQQTVFYPPAVPGLISAVFDTGPDEVTLTFFGNGTEGDIHILRQIDSGEFTEIASVAFNVTDYVDSPTLDGDYSYKLYQDNVPGESNTVTVEVDVSAPGTGSPPSDLDAIFDGFDTVSLTWTNNGGTGDNMIERKTNVGGTWSLVGNEISSATTHDNTVPAGLPYGVTYFYRVRNESVVGYSNEAIVYVPST